MSKIQVNEIVNHFDTGAPDCPKGLTVTGFTTFSGGVSIGGTLTYEDVTNIDSVGIITAQAGIHIDDSIVHLGDTNTKIRFPAADTVTVETSGSERLRITSGGSLEVKGDANPNAVFDRGSANTTNVNFNYNGTLTGQLGAANEEFQISAAGASTPLVAYVNGSERLRITSTGAIGIGSDNPDALLVVQGDSNDSTNPSIRLKDGSDTREVSITNSSGDFVASTHGIDNNHHGRIKIFESGIIDFSTGGSGGSIASRVRINGDGGMNVGNGVISSASGDGNIVVDEGIYIGTFNGDNQIRSSSAGGGSSNLFIGNAQIQVSSDRRLKENIVDTVVDASEELKKVRVVDFTWNDPSDQSFNNKNARGTWTGVIAQELVDVFPFVVNAPRKEEDLSIDHESEKTWMLNQDQLVPVLIKGFQQALTRIETLEAEVSELRGN